MGATSNDIWVIAARTGPGTHETDMLGFNLYRVSDGRMAKLNPRPVAARASGVASGARYRVIDHLSRGSKGYRLELLRLDGSRTWAGQATVRAKR